MRSPISPTMVRPHSGGGPPSVGRGGQGVGGPTAPLSLRSGGTELRREGGAWRKPPDRGVSGRTRYGHLCDGKRTSTPPRFYKRGWGRVRWGARVCRWGGFRMDGTMPHQDPLFGGRWVLGWGSMGPPPIVIVTGQGWGSGRGRDASVWRRPLW